MEEWNLLVDQSCPVPPKILGNGSPTTGCYSDNSWAFEVQADWYGSQQTSASASNLAFQAGLHIGEVNQTSKSGNPIPFYVWAVRVGQ